MDEVISELKVNSYVVINNDRGFAFCILKVKAGRRNIMPDLINALIQCDPKHFIELRNPCKFILTDHNSFNLPSVELLDCGGMADDMISINVIKFVK